MSIAHARLPGWALALIALPPGLSAGAQAPDVDAATGLIKAPGWVQVRNNCIACHSSRLITQQRGSAAHWLGLIRWMQATQNLWPLAPDVEESIVAYLADNYPPQADRRRAALGPELMPPNPYPAQRIVAAPKSKQPVP